MKLLPLTRISLYNFFKNCIKTLTGHAGASRMSIAHSNYDESEPAQIKSNCNTIIENFEKRLKLIEANEKTYKVDEITPF